MTALKSSWILSEIFAQTDGTELFETQWDIACKLS